MFKRIFCVFALVAAVATTDVLASNTCLSAGCCEVVSPAPNDGSYTRTPYSVMVYIESGHCKGQFAVYLHNGNRYIDFFNTWICIQGRSRFGYCGNWYIIR